MRSKARFSVWILGALLGIGVGMAARAAAIAFAHDGNRHDTAVGERCCEFSIPLDGALVPEILLATPQGPDARRIDKYLGSIDRPGRELKDR